MDKEGKTYIANLPYEEVWSKAEEYSISRGKMYRATYSIDKEAVRKLGKYSDVYPAFRRPFFRDVTALYTGSRNWTVALPDSLLSGQFREGDMVYLCLANRLQWQPIGYTFFKKREARFEDVGGGAVFTLAAWNGKEYAAVSSPFLLERETGKIRFIVPEAEKQELVLYRKCHLTLSVLFNDRMIGGVVEGSDRADFGSPHRVEKVVYTPRNEVNFIYKGNLYELFYWGGGKWNSVGRQMAVSDSIVYSGFQGALFYLKNHTAGKDERIFEYKDGKQIFW